MSSLQTLIVIAIVIIIFVLIALLLWMNRKQLKELDAIDQKIATIKGMQLDRDITRLDKMDLAGESLTTLNTWKKSFQDAVTNKIPQVEKLVTEAGKDNASYRLFKARKSIRQAQDIILPTFEDAKNTKDVFSELLESNRENQVQYDALLKTYRSQRKMVLADSFDYGTALDQIEDDLAEMESDFEEAKNLSSQGDHVEAKRVLSKIKIALANLDEQLPKIKAAHHQLETVFQDQLRELADAYRKMLSEKYSITEVNFLNEIKEIHDDIDASRSLLSELKVQALNEKNKKIATKIDALYGILTKEYKARPFVEKNREKVFTAINRQQIASQQLVEKLRHIDESYELTHGELDKSKRLTKEITNMGHQFTIDTQNIADGKGVYSEIENSWIAMMERLRKIVEEEQEMSQNVDGLYDSESVAIDSVKQFKQEVSLVYRRLKRRHLPGSPESFIQMYTLVVNEIKKVSQELDQVRINMEKISTELIQISDDVERLKREADDIINSANLVELTMTYSNKFADNDAVKKAQQTATQMYQVDFNYKEALDTIATAIEKVEPGSYQRLENAYYSELSTK